jgi:RNA-directed DNA polymerase
MKRPAHTAAVEAGRELAQGKTVAHNRDRTQRRSALQRALERIRAAAQRDRATPLTALWHHGSDIDRRREADHGLHREATPGVEGQTWAADGEHLEATRRDLSARLKRGTDHASPVERVSIPKAAGRQRPSGIPPLEDKSVQRATVEVLNAIDAGEFLGVSAGCRPGRSPHHALDAVTVGSAKRSSNWGLDAASRGCCEAIDHAWLVKCVEPRMGDRRVGRPIRKWLNAGGREDGPWRAQEEGTPQGGRVSPLAANLSLHDVLALWAERWRRRHARGAVSIVRYGDDVIVGFEPRDDAERFGAERRARCQKFHLDLHPEQTRLSACGRDATERRQRRGQGTPATCDVLGLTHIGGQTRTGQLTVRRKTIAKRLRKTRQEVTQTLRERRHWPIRPLGAWLKRVLMGHYRYSGVPRHMGMRRVVRDRLRRYGCHTRRRRSQRHRLSWPRRYQRARPWLPEPHLLHPDPAPRLRVTTRGRSPVRSCRTPGSVRGMSGHRHPYRDRNNLANGRAEPCHHCPSIILMSSRRCPTRVIQPVCSWARPRLQTDRCR